MAVKTFDSRRRTLWLAIGLLLAAILVAAALLQQSSSTRVYLVANRDLSAGTALSSADVRQAQLALGAESRGYLSQLRPGMILASAVVAGELIPKRAALSEIAQATKSVRITPSLPLSSRIRVGSLVQLWFVPKNVNSNTESNAVQLLGQAEVLAIHKSDSTIGKLPEDIEISVPIGNMAAVIAAIASAGFVSVVSES